MKQNPQLGEALKKASDAISAMEAAKSIQEFEGRWHDFLHAIERFWNKSLAYFQKSPKWNSWSGRFVVDRRKDELLSYLINARGAEEHTVEPITAREGGGLGINPAEGDSLYIEEMVMKNGVLSIKSPQRLKFIFYPTRIKLLPVVNRGRVYSVPTIHLGQKIDPSNVIAIANTAQNYYRQFLKEAEKNFCSS